MSLKPLPKPKLFLLILVMPGILWFCTLAAGLKGLASIRENQIIARQDREQLNLGMQTLHLVGKVQFHLQSQLHAWKNIFLPGQESEHWTLHMQTFEKEEQSVKETLNQLTQHMRWLGMGEEVGQQVDRLRAQHQLLSSQHQTAARLFIQQATATHVTTHPVRGADPAILAQEDALNDQTGQLATRVQAHVASLVDSAVERDDRWFSEESTKVAWLLAGLGLVILPIAFFTVRNHVIQPITRMSHAIEQVANGDLKQQVAPQSIEELSRMSISFNHMTAELDRVHSGLQNERDKLTTIIVAAQEGIVVTDRQGAVVLINPAAERLLQKSAEQITREGFLNLLDDPEYMMAHLEQDGIDVPKTVVYNHRVLNVHANTIHTPAGAQIGSAALLRDITEEKRLEKQLRTLSNTDAMTGLHNRRRLDEIYHDEYNRAQRYRQNLSLIMLDVDHFKRFNDEHGHDQGDRVLQAVARVMQNICREVDYPCRYGGEEFCLILPSTGLEGAKRMAERLRSGVEAMRVNGLQVTISLGVAIYPLVGSSPEALQKAADAALYQAKRAGRNRFHVAQTESPPIDG